MAENWKLCRYEKFQWIKEVLFVMKLLTLENLEKAFCMIKAKGYDEKNSQRIALDIFDIVEKYGKDVEFYIELLPSQN